MRLGRRVGFACVVSLLSMATSAHAEGDKDAARKLFVEAASLIKNGDHEGGLGRLLEAERLFHAPTHLLYIARSQQQLGRLLEARMSYKKLTEEKLPEKASKPFVQAQETGVSELAELERKIPKLSVVVSPEDAPGLAVVVGERRLASEEVGQPFAVDPGPHEIKVTATGFAPANGKLNAELGRTSELKLQLQPEGSDADAGISTSTRDSGGESGPSSMQIASFALMGGGGAVMIAGGVFGVLSIVTSQKADDRFAECGAGCRQEVLDLDDQASLFGNVGIIGLAAGAAVAGTGLILYFVGDESASSESAGVDLKLGVGFIGLSGRFQ